MHTFCCVSAISDRNPVNSPACTLSILNSRMAPLPPVNGFRNNNGQIHNKGNHVNNHSLDSLMSLSMSMSRVPSMREPTHLSSGDQREVKINDIVGNGISGILHKWVNYGKGWRPRWFVLQDGVLSYYKIHGPDKIIVNQETEKGSKVIGDESLRRISRDINGSSQLRRNPVGEVHLKV